MMVFKNLHLLQVDLSELSCCNCPTHQESIVSWNRNSSWPFLPTYAVFDKKIKLRPMLTSNVYKEVLQSHHRRQQAGREAQGTGKAPRVSLCYYQAESCTSCSMYSSPSSSPMWVNGVKHPSNILRKACTTPLPPCYHFKRFLMIFPAQTLYSQEISIFMDAVLRITQISHKHS